MSASNLNNTIFSDREGRVNPHMLYLDEAGFDSSLSAGVINTMILEEKSTDVMDDGTLPFDYDAFYMKEDLPPWKQLIDNDMRWHRIHPQFRDSSGSGFAQAVAQKEDHIVHRLNKYFQALIGYQLIAYTAILPVQEAGDKIRFARRIQFFEAKYLLQQFANYAVIHWCEDRNKWTRVSLFRIWFHSSERLNCSNFCFRPNMPYIIEDNDRTLFDMWRGFNIPRKEAVAFVEKMSDSEYKKFHHRWTDHLKTNLCGNAEDVYNYFHNWLAHIIQKPWQRTNVAVVMSNDPGGSGASVLFELLQRIIGMQQSYLCDGKELLEDRINSQFSYNILLFADDVFSALNERADSKIKSLIAEDTIEVRKHFTTPIKVENTINLIISSNLSSLIGGTTGDGRYQYISASNEYAGTSTRAKKYWASIFEIPIEVIAYDLYTRDISGWNSTATVQQRQ
jgi:hypothetical protein